MIHCSECGFSCSLREDEKLYPDTLGCLIKRGDPILGSTHTWCDGFCDSAEPRNRWIYKEDYDENNDILYMYIKNKPSYAEARFHNVDVLRATDTDELVGFVFYHAKEEIKHHTQLLAGFGYTYYPNF